MEKITFECDHGYILKGNTTIQCQYDSTWDFPVPHCVKVLQCTPPPFISNGKHDGHRLANFPVGTYVNYTCNRGYLLVGGTSSHCMSSGRWSQPVPQCEGCLAPQEIANGKPNTKLLEDFAYGSSITYHCDPGYILSAIGCILLQIPGSKKTKVENMIQCGDNVTVECEDGYVLEGSPYIQCQDDFAWDPPVPVCKPGFNLMASISIGSLVGFLLLLVISGIWMAVSKCNKGRYTPANRKEISNSSNGRIECPSVL
uniref:Uncharacterized protein n=1 Tax=Sphaerodactylus townsendi TaxID=933632 RepID=A0ACB8F5J9_9SAUR